MSKKKTDPLKGDISMANFYDTPRELLHKRKSFNLVPKVRERVLNLYESDKLFCDECDINRIKSDVWSVQRFIEKCNDDEEKAIHDLVVNLKWRKAFGVNTHSLDKDIGREFFNIGALFVYNQDKNGYPLLFNRGKCTRKIPKMRPLFEIFFIAIIEKLDREVGSGGYVFVLDCSDTSLNNLNMDLIKFVITSFQEQYPRGLQSVIIYNMPWILRGIWKLVKGWLGDSQHLVRFANGDEIQEYVSVENLPKYMGGECDKSFTIAPDNCPSVYDLSFKYGFTSDEVKKYMKGYEDLLEEAKHYK